MHRLTRHQLVAVLVCLLPVYGLVVWDAWEHRSGPPARGTGWVLVHDVPAGARIEAGDVASLPLTYGEESFAYLTDSPVARVTAVPLHQGTLLSADDLLASSAATADVAIEVTSPPPLGVGATVDIYAATGGDVRRVGSHVPVVALSPLTIRVPAADAPAWLVLAASHTQFLVAATADPTSTGVRVVDACTAIAELSGAPGAGCAK